MKELRHAVEERRAELNELLHRLSDGNALEEKEWASLRCSLYLIDVLCIVMRRAKPEDGQRLVLDAFGAPGQWGYGTPIGDALLETLRSEEPNPNRWHDLAKYPEDLPDAEIQVLAFDGERHQLAYIGGGDFDGVWMEVENDEPTMFSPVAWRHLDNPAA